MSLLSLGTPQLSQQHSHSNRIASHRITSPCALSYSLSHLFTVLYYTLHHHYHHHHHHRVAAVINTDTSILAVTYSHAHLLEYETVQPTIQPPPSHPFCRSVSSDIHNHNHNHNHIGFPTILSHTFHPPQRIIGPQLIGSTDSYPDKSCAQIIPCCSAFALLSPLARNANNVAHASRFSTFSWTICCAGTAIARCYITAPLS